MKRIIILLIILCLISVSFLHAANGEGENLKLKIAVMGQGDEVYFWFGHIGLIIENSNTGESRFYDYGLFSFDTENFFTNFIFGRLIYMCGVSPTERNLAVYININRSITIYSLDVPPENRKKIFDFVENNVKPENRDYYYHFFKDNCSTRIRDIIDIAANGQFSGEFGSAPGRFTIRQHVRRHTYINQFIDWILNFWMGQVIDTPVTVWQEMFLPSEVAKRIDNFTYIDGNGVERKLVTSVQKIYEAHDRGTVLDTPLKQWPREFIFSIVLSLIFSIFFFLQMKNIKAGRILAGLSMSITGLLFGIAALALYFMNIFTNHDYTFQNFNMIFCTPHLLASVPLGIFYAFTKKKEKMFVYNIWLRLIWFISLAGIIISMALNLLPDFYQDNLTDKLLMLPVCIAFTFHPAEIDDVIIRIFSRKKQINEA